VPRNQDGEVAEFALLPVPEVRALVERSEAMTTDAALVTIDFLLRHRLLDDLSVQQRVLSLRVPARAG